MSSIVVAGDTSGTVTLQAPSVAGTTTLTLPSTSATLLTDSSSAFNIGSGQLYKDASGNIGIGTTSPNKTLEVKNGADYQIRVNNGTTAQSYDMGRSTSNGLMYFYGNQTGFTGYVFTGIDGERMRIDTSGRLLLAGTSAIAGYQFTMYHTDTGGMAYKYNGTSEQNSCSFQNGNGQVGRIYTSGSNTTYSTSSDYRLKENVVPMTGALDKVAQLNPVTFTWKTDGTDGQGFIAHELQAVVPDCVGGTKDAVDADGNPVYQDIDTSFLVATLTAAIKEQQTIINDLKARVIALEGAA